MSTMESVWRGTVEHQDVEHNVKVVTNHGRESIAVHKMVGKKWVRIYQDDPLHDLALIEKVAQS